MGKKIVIKVLKEGIHSTTNVDPEGSMAKNQLSRIEEVAPMLNDLIGEQTDLEEWVESKITLAHDYLTTVFDYMKGEQQK